MPDWLIVVGVVLLNLMLLTGIMFALAHLGPWHRLATQYPADDPPHGTRYRFVSLGCGWVGYNNGLDAVATDDRLTLRVMPPFDWILLFHPPFTLPRSAVHDVQFSRVLGWIPCVTFQVAGFKLRLHGGVVQSEFWQTDAGIEA
jgi:hypothetical protein